MRAVFMRAVFLRAVFMRVVREEEVESRSRAPARRPPAPLPARAAAARQPAGPPQVPARVRVVEEKKKSFRGRKSPCRESNPESSVINSSGPRGARLC